MFSLRNKKNIMWIPLLSVAMCKPIFRLNTTVISYTPLNKNLKDLETKNIQMNKIILFRNCFKDRKKIMCFISLNSVNRYMYSKKSDFYKTLIVSRIYLLHKDIFRMKSVTT